MAIYNNQVNMDAFKTALVECAFCTPDELSSMTFNDMCAVGEVFNVHVSDYIN